MRALTVQQPWAWAIFNGKNVENRTQLWRYRGPLAIHAGLRLSERGIADHRIQDAYRQWSRRERVDAWEKLHEHFSYGVILGVVDLVDVHPDAGCCRPWGESAYPEHGSGRTRRDVVHLVHENSRLLAEPIPCAGALGLWTPPADVVERIAA